MVPVVMRLARRDRAARTVDVVLALGAAGALVGIVEFAMLGYSDLENRPMGLLSHYMTYAGVLMLVSATAAARLLFDRGLKVWPAVAVPALLVALAVTLTVNAYVGITVALVVLAAMRDKRLLIALPVAIVAGVFIAPQPVRERILTLSPQQASNRDRLQMLAMGREIVRDHPLLGVGPEMIGVVYADYLQPNPVHTYNPHLHNVPVQIAAERGIPALLAWLAFVVTAVVGLVRLFRAGRVRWLAAGGIASVAAMLSAGLFEYNFCDSEFLMLFLGLITLPFAAAGDVEPAAPRVPRPAREGNAVVHG
jgi:O-antigen ligase